MTVSWTRDQREKGMNLEYVFIEFADGYQRGASKEKRRIKKKIYQLNLSISPKDFGGFF